MQNLLELLTLLHIVVLLAHPQPTVCLQVRHFHRHAIFGALQPGSILATPYHNETKERRSRVSAEKRGPTTTW